MGILSFCFLVLSMNELVSGQITTEPSEVAAINKLIDYWGLKSKLNITIDPCTADAPWAPVSANPRVACDCAANICHITHLKIYALDISGELPQELFQLTELMDLNLGQNILSGSIPPEIGNLLKMQYLSLGINNFSGRVPVEFGKLTKLKSLSFSSNNFNGPLPVDLGKLTSLEQLYIDSSGVSGPIPQELSNLKSLHTVWASDNGFTGKLPEFFGTFTNLTTLRLEGTNLEGPIPSSYAALTKLEDLRIGDLSGEDSTLDFLVNLASLSILSLRSSRVSGEIPPQIGTFPNLQSLDLSFNKLTGSIPNTFQDSQSLHFLYLGSNMLTGEIPSNIITPQLRALDISFNSITGNLPANFAKIERSLNVVGTLVNGDGLLDGKASEISRCLLNDNKCIEKVPINSFAIKCGGSQQISSYRITFDDDSEILGASSIYTSSNNHWAVSNTGSFISNPNGPQYTTQTASQITGTLDSELYKTARVSPNSLRYYGLGLRNGRYNVELHFSEIQMDDSESWRGLGKRLFDIYIQGERVVQDFNIKEEAYGVKRALVKLFEANVTNANIDIHFKWAGKGTCCIPVQSTFGPLVSAIYVSQVSTFSGSSNGNKKQLGRIVGLTLGVVAGLFIAASVFYLWWVKKTPEHIRVGSDSPKKNLNST
ncbi:probable LRR receptor-like serine/threonine-protein kinase At1g56130 [Helianthus annuus]|uniref:non-specific serine/threonine protein kinase n=1 Tax=Helianthus annuus TaxID=4232 RepID=A0A251SRQ4_HELAN|nr:probable LRR receptor-like serine/threonine-protein kinase At1g56130 [Helianthus annuus]